MHRGEGMGVPRRWQGGPEGQFVLVLGTLLNSPFIQSYLNTHKCGGYNPLLTLTTKWGEMGGNRAETSCSTAGAPQATVVTCLAQQ